MRRASSHVVGGNERGNALMANELDQLAEDVRGACSDLGFGRLVGEQKFAPIGEATAHGGALLFAA